MRRRSAWRLAGVWRSSSNSTECRDTRREWVNVVTVTYLWALLLPGFLVFEQRALAWFEGVIRPNIYFWSCMFCIEVRSGFLTFPLETDRLVGRIFCHKWQCADGSEHEVDWKSKQIVSASVYKLAFVRGGVRCHFLKRILFIEVIFYSLDHF